jgi:hypothetical protein
VPGERAHDCEAQIHQGVLVVDPAVVRGRRSDLPREICAMSQNVTESEAIHSDGAAEVSKGRTTPEDRRKARTVPRKGNKGKGK